MYLGGRYVECESCLIDQKATHSDSQSSGDRNNGFLGTGPTFDFFVFTPQSYVVADDSPRSFYEQSTHRAKTLFRDSSHSGLLAS